MRITQRKGDTATAQALSTFTRMGYDVSIPFTESAAYDLIVDVNDTLYRVQCKYTSAKEVGLRRIHSNTTGYVTKKTPENAYDWLYVLNKEGSEFLIQECLSGRTSIVPKEAMRIGEQLVLKTSAG